tara:strand:- start:1142 stop:1615 length:474 start_codon:yes stop_codon:yes gene_type:complete
MVNNGKYTPGDSRVLDGNGNAVKDTFDSAFVALDERVLDPTLLTQSLLDRLPQPKGWRIMVMPYQGKETSKGGIIMPEKTRSDLALATVVCYVLKLGPLCYSDEEKFGDTPWCKEKDWILIGRYSGSRFGLDGGELRIINDDEVLGTILDPDDVSSL